MKALLHRLDTRPNRLLGFLCLFVLIVGALAPRYLLPANLIGIFLSAAVVGMVGIAETLVIIGGGLDISVTSLVMVSALAVAMTISAGVPVPVAIVLGLLASTLMGTLNGTLIAFLKIPAIIVTLAMLRISRGAIMIGLGGSFVRGVQSELGVLSTGHVGPVPVVVLVFLGTAVLVSAFLNWTRWGRMIFVMGGNQTAADLSGVPVKTVQLSLYVISGFLCGLTGVCLLTRVPGMDISYFQGFEFIAIAATVIGGTSLLGGAGSISGTVFGVLLLYAAYASLVFLRIDAAWQNTVTGMLILLAVAMDVLRGRKANA